MKLLYIGHSHYNSGAIPFLGAHIAGARDGLLPEALCSLGVDVTITTQPGAGHQNLLPYGAQQQRLDLCHPCDYDVLVVADYGGYQSIHSVPSFKEAMLGHSRLVVLADGAPSHSAYKSWAGLIERAAAVGATTAPMAAEYKRAYPDKHVFLSTYGFSDVNPALPRPYPEGEKIVFFCGRMMRNFIPSLVELAQVSRWQVWIASLFMEPEIGEDATRRFYLKEEARERLLPGVHFVSDLAPYQQPGGEFSGCGPVGRKNLWPFLVHADVAINFMHPASPRNVLHCKLYDYLSAGCPVVTQPGTPNAGDVLALNAGSVVERREDFADAIWSEINHPRDRQAIREGALLYGSWKVQARRLVQAIEEVM